MNEISLFSCSQSGIQRDGGKPFVTSLAGLKATLKLEHSGFFTLKPGNSDEGHKSSNRVSGEYKTPVRPVGVRLKPNQEFSCGISQVHGTRIFELQNQKYLE
ncbi:hypothetical protein TNIN_390991 [Trichonephila inaurata madagascariensis]|uniref:Uncharacterized protein n=1 Tax=Trichonephila inaurata madagascariensis TaxID=2747483 RepID=A0A8X6XSL5_9ARAC|nr:hypothetical protein TNIN_390991 [Trichonephila inaurata madagascariensis]